MIDWAGLGTAVLIPIGRSVGGWLTKALKDNKISKFEITKLGETVLKTTIYGCLIFFGAEGAGISIEPIAAAGSAVILDLILSAIKENRNITKR